MEFGRGSSEQKIEQDAMVEEALRNFRASVHAWSEAEYGKPRAVQVVHLTSWRVVAGWALGCALAIGSLGGGVTEFHHRHELAKIAQAEAERQENLAKAQEALKVDEDLLAKVDSDLSRQVPRAMEPLAQLMEDDEEQ